MRPDEPTSLDQDIASLQLQASTRLPTTSLVFKLDAHRPQILVRPGHPRARERLAPVLRQELRELAGGNRSWPLYLWSQGPGTGKTSAGLVMLDHYGRRVHTCGCEVLDELLLGFADFATMPELFRGAERRRPGVTVSNIDLWNGVKRMPLLVLDDLRKPGDREQRLGDDHYGVLKRVLDLRIGRPLIITSNVDPWERPPVGQSDLVRLFDDRIADRIVCGTVFGLAGTSRR